MTGYIIEWRLKPRLARSYHIDADLRWSVFATDRKRRPVVYSTRRRAHAAIRRSQNHGANPFQYRLRKAPLKPAFKRPSNRVKSVQSSVKPAISRANMRKPALAAPSRRKSLIFGIIRPHSA